MLKRGTITENGALTARFEHLQDRVKSEGKTNKQDSACRMSGQKDRVLLIGSGYVAGPLVDYLRRRNVRVTVASGNLVEAQGLAGRFPGVEAFHLNISDSENLLKFVKECDVAVRYMDRCTAWLVAAYCLTALH